MKNKFHLLLWLSVFILLSITIIVFSDTLALFETDSSGVVNSDIGKWIIKINNETITETVNETINVDNFRYSSNQHVQNGYIAPGGSAYFDLVVDATDCDVAVLYDISFDLESTNYDENITFEIENLSGGSIVRTDEYVYSGIISLAAIENDETYTIRVTIFWDDFEEYNESDTELGGVEDSLITIPVTFHAIQYLDETLEEYDSSANVYHVVLDKRGGSGGTSEFWYQRGAFKTINGTKCYYFADSSLTTCLPNNQITAPTKSGKAFDGYYTKTAGDGSEYIDHTNAVVNNLYRRFPKQIDSSYTDTITLYAGWGNRYTGTATIAANVSGVYNVTGTFTATYQRGCSDSDCNVQSECSCTYTATGTYQRYVTSCNTSNCSSYSDCTCRVQCTCRNESSFQMNINGGRSLASVCNQSCQSRGSTMREYQIISATGAHYVQADCTTSTCGQSTCHCYYRSNGGVYHYDQVVYCSAYYWNKSGCNYDTANTNVIFDYDLIKQENGKIVGTSTVKSIASTPTYVIAKGTYAFGDLSKTIGNSANSSSSNWLTLKGTDGEPFGSGNSIAWRYTNSSESNNIVTQSSNGTINLN